MKDLEIDLQRLIDASAAPVSMEEVTSRSSAVSPRRQAPIGRILVGSAAILFAIATIWVGLAVGRGSPTNAGHLSSGLTGCLAEPPLAGCTASISQARGVLKLAVPETRFVPPGLILSSSRLRVNGGRSLGVLHPPVSFEESWAPQRQRDSGVSLQFVVARSTASTVGDLLQGLVRLDSSLVARGYLDRNGISQLAWVYRGMRISLSAHGLMGSEVLRFARSLDFQSSSQKG
jgi:hypothetical protein